MEEEQYYTENEKPCKEKHKDCPPADLPLDNVMLMGVILVFVICKMCWK